MRSLSRNVVTFKCHEISSSWWSTVKIQTLKWRFISIWSRTFGFSLVCVLVKRRARSCTCWRGLCWSWFDWVCIYLQEPHGCRRSFHSSSAVEISPLCRPSQTGTGFHGWRSIGPRSSIWSRGRRLEPSLLTSITTWWTSPSLKSNPGWGQKHTPTTLPTTSVTILITVPTVVITMTTTPISSTTTLINVPRGFQRLVQWNMKLQMFWNENLCFYSAGHLCDEEPQRRLHILLPLLQHGLLPGEPGDHWPLSGEVSQWKK